MRILIVTDAWEPQVNGVVRTLAMVGHEAEALGHRVAFVTPEGFRTIPCPTYPEIRLALWPGARMAALIGEFSPDAIHIATEGPLGLAARRHCLRRGLPFTTAYHTRFPEYIAARHVLPTSAGYALMRWFHAPSSGIMVATQSMARELEKHGFQNLRPWTRGVDTKLFRPRCRDDLGAPHPIFLFVGRVAVEKNIEAFLKLDLPGTKIVVGDGPALVALRSRFRQTRFMGERHGEDLARIYASCDVFVFPSRTDTFGLVLLEALASGLPVAAYPVPGPLDIIGEEPNGSAGANGHGNGSANGTAARAGRLDEDLARAAMAALAIPGEVCRARAMQYSWRGCAELFVRNLAPFRVQAVDPAPLVAK